MKSFAWINQMVLHIPKKILAQDTFSVTMAKAFDMSCEDGFHFSVREGTCLKAEEVPCYDGVRLCNNDNVGHFFQEPENCNGYFTCKSGDVAEHFTCSNGLHFNPNTFQCDFPYNANCQYNHEEHNYCTAYSDNGNKNFFFVPDAHKCSRYYFCYNGQQKEFVCPEGSHFDPFNNYCTKPHEAGCKATPECPTEGFHVFPHPANCRKYVFCVDGTPHVQSCGPNFFFDYQASECRATDESVCFDH
uniref:Chitin-binding type-2 domain-containing protein n=1 Tax=Phlebotomus papatasi TaxID=29031 RepID=A0A1B0DLW3_PHLPP